MSYSSSARTTTGQVRIRWSRVAGLFVVAAAVAVALGSQHPGSSSTTAASGAQVHRHERPGAPEVNGAVVRGTRGGALGEADGAVPDGATVFDDQVPGVARLDPALLGALRRAATDGAASGVAFLVDSGWRSPQYQEQLLREAILKYGSEAEAARWVAPPNASAHVKGQAIDLGSTASAWLRENGARYGLCQIYANEPWHFELRPDAVDHGCPAVFADPTHDPSMQQ